MSLPLLFAKGADKGILHFPQFVIDTEIMYYENAFYQDFFYIDRTVAKSRCVRNFA